jgi:two-component system phosphate regulon sensor histidine kinase PhoR
VKNLKPYQLAIILSLPISLIAVLFHLLFLHANLGWWEPLVMFIIIVAGTTFIIFYAIEKFVYRKIKLIYKSIHRLKLGKDLKYSLGERISEDPIKDVQKEVMDWASDKRTEIENLKRTEQFRKEFLHNLSHEFKTPLFSIQGFLQTLIDGAIDDPEVNVKFLEKANKGVERLCNLVDDLDEISKLESGELKLYPIDFDINTLTKEVFDSLEMKAFKRTIKLHVKKGCDHPFWVHADREKVGQVMINLITNSIKYGKEEGETVVGYYDMGDNILIEVTDDGIGISEEHLPRLFERFYRVDRSRSREAGGTGLGLSIVKHIVEAHEQTIHVRSTMGVGSTFGFTLKKR